MSTVSLEKNRLQSIDLTPLAINVTTVFTFVNRLEHELLEGFLLLYIIQLSPEGEVYIHRSSPTLRGIAVLVFTKSGPGCSKGG